MFSTHKDGKLEKQPYFPNYHPKPTYAIGVRKKINELLKTPHAANCHLAFFYISKCKKYHGTI